MNGKFTQHVGTFGTVSWFPRERLAVQLFGGFNWLSQESAFNGEPAGAHTPVIEHMREKVAARPG